MTKWSGVSKTRNLIRFRAKLLLRMWNYLTRLSRIDERWVSNSIWRSFRFSAMWIFRTTASNICSFELEYGKILLKNSFCQYFLNLSLNYFSYYSQFPSSLFFRFLHDQLDGVLSLDIFVPLNYCFNNHIIDLMREEGRKLKKWRKMKASLRRRFLICNLSNIYWETSIFSVLFFHLSTH